MDAKIIGLITAKQNAFQNLPTSNLKYAILNPLNLGDVNNTSKGEGRIESQCTEHAIMDKLG